MDIAAQIAAELNIKAAQARAAIDLIDEGNTIPFIARYRKEVTGALNDEVLRNLFERLSYLRNLQERKEAVLKSIREQELLTPEIEKQILEAKTQVEVEDLYRPFKPKRRTRAIIAKEKGLEPLALEIMLQRERADIKAAAKNYIDSQKGVETIEEAIAGARDIIAENISDDAGYRSHIRDISFKKGILSCRAKDEKAESVYEMYYDFEEALPRLAGHRILAINRGEKEKFLTVSITAPQEDIYRYLDKQILRQEKGECADIIREAIRDSYDRLISPSIERELRSSLTQTAEEGAIRVFGQNLRQLLLQPPIKGRVVLGWDPAFRTGCKIAVVDATGKVLDTTVIYPTQPQNKVAESKKIIHGLIKKYGVSLISLGNGTASRESEQIIAELIKEIPERVEYIIVNEAGASVYSASKLASQEFPNFDVGQRSAASMARRLQDPLAELVKIDPKSVGVGQYQHDMNQKALNDALSGVVEDCVNSVGVDLNTASAPLLSYVSGISPAVAKNIVSYREENGVFRSRSQLLKVAKLGPKAYEQCAGFLRIPGAKDPLDGTAVHPESYAAARKMLEALGLEEGAIAAGGIKGLSKQLKDQEKMARELGIGVLTLRDIVSELEKPGRDIREDMPKPVLRSDVLEMKDLKEGMILKGTVRNVIDFGAFVDIGVHQDGLVHISQICDRYIKHPLDALSVGDVVEVKVLSVDIKKQRIGLTMKLDNK